VLYIESDSVQIAKYGFLHRKPKSIWVALEHEEERRLLDAKLADLHRRSKIRLYFVSACADDDESDINGLHEELDGLDFTSGGLL
jgi:hypothetical protein